ncbi:hypothetical protein [Rhodoflexus sp.]
MKKLKIALTITCLVGSGHWLMAQEHDDVYFTPKDRKQTNATAAILMQPSVLGSPAQAFSNDPVQSKFANPEFREQTGNNISILPYFRKDYNQNNTMAGAFRNWNAPGAGGFWNNMSFGTSAFWGMSPFMANRIGMGLGWGMNPMMIGWADPWMMNRMMMGWAYPWMMNRMMMWDPFWGGGMMGMGMMNPMMMGWADPWMMNRMMMWDPFWGGGMLWNPFFRPGVLVAAANDIRYGARTDRSSVYTPVRARADEFRSGRTEENTVRSSRYGNFDNSSAGRSAYVTNEYNSGRSSGYAGRSEWATGRSSGYEARQSGYSSGSDAFRNSNMGTMNSGRSSSYGGGSFGGGRSSGGGYGGAGVRGGRGN